MPFNVEKNNTLVFFRIQGDSGLLCGSFPDIYMHFSDANQEVCLVTQFWPKIILERFCVKYCNGQEKGINSP